MDYKTYKYINYIVLKMKNFIILALLGALSYEQTEAVLIKS